MLVTDLDFTQIMDWFTSQNKYDFLLLYVSSFDDRDTDIIWEVVNNYSRIDRVTGDRVCFLYFTRRSSFTRNESVVQWVREMSDRSQLYSKGVDITMDIADEVRGRFHILRSDLPAFVLITRDPLEIAKVFSIDRYSDFKNFLIPLNLLHSFIEDRESIVAEYESELRRIQITQEEVDRRAELRHNWEIDLERHERKKRKELSMGLAERAASHDLPISYIKQKLELYPPLKVAEDGENVVYPSEKLERVREVTANQLNAFLGSQEGGAIIDDFLSRTDYQRAVLTIWDKVTSRKVMQSEMIADIRIKVSERQFDVFISCKSEDYSKAREVCDFLASNGFKPFLADGSLREIGNSQYTDVIGEVINVCRHMIVFTTDARYLETSYVRAEWSSFATELNSGRKPGGQLVNVISPDVNIDNLPYWLRDKQCCTTENYRSELLCYLQAEADD